MWSEEEIRQRVADNDARIDAIKNDEDYDEDDEETREEIQLMEQETSTLNSILNDSTRPLPTDGMTLNELLKPVVDQGFFVQVYPNPAENQEMLTISLDGVPAREYLFDLGAFMKKMLLTCKDYTPYGHMTVEINIGLLKLTDERGGKNER